MSKKKNKVEFVGQTNDGRRVAGGLFHLFDTTGLPLDIIFDLCQKYDIQPSWPHFYQEAYVHGWQHKTIMNRLESSLCDSYGKDYSDVVMGRLKKLYPG